MDVLVRLDALRRDAPVLAHVQSLPSPSFGAGTRREVVTLYGDGDAPAQLQALLLALAASVECEGLEGGRRGAVRQLGVRADRGAQGDAAWRDAAGALVTRDLDIPLGRLEAKAAELLGENGSTLRRVAAGLAMPDWPEGTERALNFTLRTRGGAGGSGAYAAIGHPAIGDDHAAEHWLDTMRSADALAFDVETD
jgi:hypothetical protein